MLTHFFAALRRFLRDAATRGEDDAPEVEDIPQTGCPVNATPHRCTGVFAGSDLDYARPVPLPSVPFGTGEALARELTDYLKENC